MSTGPAGSLECQVTRSRIDSFIPIALDPLFIGFDGESRGNAITSGSRPSVWTGHRKLFSPARNGFARRSLLTSPVRGAYSSEPRRTEGRRRGWQRVIRECARGGCIRVCTRARIRTERGHAIDKRAYIYSGTLTAWEAEGQGRSKRADDGGGWSER